MTGVFSGGLVYEFTQEENDYGIVKINQDESAEILKEFDSLQDAFEKSPDNPTIPSNTPKPARPVKCPPQASFENITANLTLPTTLGAEYIKSGVDKTKFKKGKFVTNPTLTIKYTIKKSDGNELKEKTIKEKASYSQTPIPEGGIGIDIGGGTGAGSGSSGSGNTDEKKDNGAGSAKRVAFGWSLGLISVGFAVFL
jgi:hypothetical protein